MMNSNSGLDHFLHDERFIDWVKNPDGIYKEYWQQYFNQYPNEVRAANEAAVFLQQLYYAEKTGYKNVREDVKAELWQRIEEGAEAEPTVTRKSYKKYWLFAASLLIVITTGIFLKMLSVSNSPKPSNNVAEYNTSEQEIFNNTKVYKAVYLSDGSTVNLAPGASLKNKRVFSDKRREVYLHGTAFFQVAKDSSKPFYVYTGKIITRVVGTSFSISYLSDNSDITVAVRTGKVLVYRKDNEKSAEGVKVLRPLQQCTYRINADKLETGLVADSTALAAQALADNNLSFEEVPMEKVLEAIEKRFGVTLIYDKAEMENIFITVTLKNESLENMLRIVCKTTGTAYRIDNDFIFIDKQK